MGRHESIQDNKFKVLISPRQERVENNQIKKQPRNKTWVHRIIQWRLIGYIVIGVSLWKLNQDINYLIFQMFLLILFTELQSRGVHKKDIDKLKQDLQLDNDIEYKDRESLRVQALHKQEKEDALKAKKSIEDNYLD